MNRSAWLVIPFLLMMVVFGVAVTAQETGEKTPAPPEAAVKPLRFISSLDAPPFGYIENMKKVGFEIDLGEAIGEVLGRPVQWVKRAFNVPALAADLNAGRGEAVITSLTATEARKEYFIFTVPYYRTSLAVATYRDIDWNQTAFRNGLSRVIRVGVLRRSTGEEWARKHLQATREAFDSPARLARALNGREVGLILVDELILNWELARRHYKFQVVERGIDPQDYAIAVSRSNPELAEELNRALRKLEEDGRYSEIYQKWFSVAGQLPQLGD